MAWFVANDRLSEVVSFPIITRMPSVVAALIGAFVYGEITVRYTLGEVKRSFAKEWRSFCIAGRDRADLSTFVGISRAHESTQVSTIHGNTSRCYALFVDCTTVLRIIRSYIFIRAKAYILEGLA